MKQLLIANDLSCVGKVSISATLPILSLAQVETSLLPTVLLSAHTGFSNIYRQSLTQDMVHILKHFKELTIQFDAILTGYLSDEIQIQTFIDCLPETKQLIVDPVMADNGKLYSGFSNQYPVAMRQLCQKAHMIIPNLTEACLLMNRPFLTDYHQQDIYHLLKSLQQLGPQIVMITGISFEPKRIGVAYLDGDTFGYCHTHYVHQSFSGTGDIFSALVTALLLHGVHIDKAIQTTLDFIVKSLEDTLTLSRDVQYGIVFEKQLPALSTTLSKLLNLEGN